jgi:hypothetical protein
MSAAAHQQPPTALSLLRQEIDRFLQSDKPEVLCIRGKWGVGKTFSWDIFLKDAYRRKIVKLKKYAYVSLFGLESLDKFKFSIFENTIPLKIGNEPTLQTFSKSVGGLGVGAINLLKPGSAAFAESVTFMSVRDLILCVDDLERRGDKLRLIDVLGLASFLKEHRGCKVVLILNDEQLDEKEKFEKYSEKVIDTSLVFAPTAAEAVDIALDKAPSYANTLIDCCTRLGIANIRVLRKIERLVGLVESLLKALHPLVMNQAISTLVLFGWAVYEKQDGILKFAVTNRNNNRFQLGDEKHTEEESEWDVRLDSYGFGLCDSFDKELLEGIKAGFFNVPEITRTAAEIDAGFKDAARKELLDKPWDLYRDSFDDNAGHFIESLKEAFANHIGGITWSYLESAVRVLKKIGEAEEARRLLEAFMKHNEHEPKAFFEPDLISEIADPVIKAAMDEKIQSFVDKRDAANVIFNIAKNSGWNQEDITLIATLSPEDFYEIFKRLRGAELRTVGRRALEFRRESMKAGDIEYKTIGENALTALRRIAAESPINAERVSSLYKE